MGFSQEKSKQVCIQEVHQGRDANGRVRETTNVEWFADPWALGGEITGTTSQRKWWPQDSNVFLTGEQGKSNISLKIVRFK